MKTITEAQYLYLKAKKNVATLKNRTKEISDEEYEDLIQYSDKTITPINNNDNPGTEEPENPEPEEPGEDDEDDISEYIITIPKQPDYYEKYYNYPASPFIKNGFLLDFVDCETTEGYIGGIDVKQFQGGGSLTDVIIPNYMLYQVVSTNKHKIVCVNGSCFENCTTLQNVKLNKFINHFVQRVFYNCTSLQNINLNNIKSIGAYTFYNCTSLQNIILSKNGCTIDEYSFCNCTSLQNIENISGNIPRLAFAGCTSLQSIKLPNNANSIEHEAFWNCTSLSFIEIPCNVTGIGTAAFGKCLSLKNFISYSNTKFNLLDIFTAYSNDPEENKTIIDNLYVLDDLIDQYKNDIYVTKYQINVKSISEYITE